MKINENQDPNRIPLSTWVDEVRADVESGRDIDDALQDLEFRLENEFDADEDTIRNIIGDVELNLGDLRYGDDLNESTMERMKFLAGIKK
jgi:hypothetical protein